VNKAEHNERLRRFLRNVRCFVEFKHANISAVLTLHGYLTSTDTNQGSTSSRCSSRSYWSA
jgi:hypothetical protein